MKSIAARRARIARVRHVQHLDAAARAAAAEGQVSQLEMNAAKLASLRDSLAPGHGVTTGAELRNAGELAARLDKVRDGLSDAIVGARATAQERVAERIDARQKQESAIKLDERAAQALAAWTELRRAAPHRRRGSYRTEGAE